MLFLETRMNYAKMDCDSPDIAEGGFLKRIPYPTNMTTNICQQAVDEAVSQYLGDMNTADIPHW